MTEKVSCMNNRIAVPIKMMNDYVNIFGAAFNVENRGTFTVSSVQGGLVGQAYVEFDNVGTLESFNSDGLRSIIYTMPHIPNMKEKTLRYPGHVEYIRVLKESGFFDEETININGTQISPLDFTSKILFNEQLRIL